MRSRAVVVTIAAVIAASSAAAAQAPTGLTPAGAGRAIESALPLVQGRAPGCAVAVASDTGLVAARYRGFADLEHDVLIGPQSVFHVASLSKQFTALAVAMLIAEGRMSLDDSIGTYVEGLSPPVSGLRLRELLTHTSGIRDQWTLLSLAGWGEDEPRSQEDILWLLRRQRALNFPPGETWLYSNSGYTLLAEAVETASGTPLPELLRRRVFEPLGMRQTHFQTDHDAVVPGRVSGYEPADEPDAPRPSAWRASNPVFDTWGATGLLTTAPDLARWTANLLAPRVEPAAVRLLRSFRGPVANGASRYGFGVVHWVQGGRAGFGHGGTDEGFWADLLVFTDDGFGVLALCNASNATPYDMTPAVARTILGARWKEPPPPPAGPRAAERPDSAAPTAPSRLERAELAGVYRSDELATEWTLHAEGDSLVLERPRGRREVLRPTGRDRFAFGPYTLRVRLDSAAVTGFEVESARVRGLRFDRRPEGRR